MELEISICSFCQKNNFCEINFYLLTDQWMQAEEIIKFDFIMSSFWSAWHILFLWEYSELNPGQLGKKRKDYLYYAPIRAAVVAQQ